MKKTKKGGAAVSFDFHCINILVQTFLFSLSLIVQIFIIIINYDLSLRQDKVVTSFAENAREGDEKCILWVVPYSPVVLSSRLCSRHFPWKLALIKINNCVYLNFSDWLLSKLSQPSIFFLIFVASLFGFVFSIYHTDSSVPKVS